MKIDIKNFGAFEIIKRAIFTSTRADESLVQNLFAFRRNYILHQTTAEFAPKLMEKSMKKILHER